MKIVLVIVLVLQMIQQINTIVCSGAKPYQYNGVCYAECPWSPPTITYLDTQTGSCVTNCPSPLYFADDSTKICTQNCPSYPIMTFYDHGRQKCVEKCPSAPSQYAYASNRSCLAECPSPLYADESTRNCLASCPTGMVYQIVGTLRICTSKCYPNFYANETKICVTADLCPNTPVKYYGDDLTGFCVKSCPQNSDTYAQESTRKCVQHCTLGTFADPTTLRCVSTCPTMPAYYGSNTTRMCHLQCIEGEFAYQNNRQCYAVCPQGFGDFSTRSCVDVCPQKNKTFADPQTKLCIAVCSPGYFADNSTRSCVSAVDCTGDLVGNPINLQCINGQDCPVGYFIDYTLFLCVKRCISGEYANLDTRVCGTSCPWNPPINITFKDGSTRKCVLECPGNPRTFSDNVTRSCVNICPDPYFGSPLNYDCVDTCPDGFYGETLTNLCVSTCTTNTSSILYFYGFNTSCLNACPQGTYKDNTTLSCVQICPDDTFAREDTNECVPNCPNTTFGDKHSRSCVSACPAITKQYADDSTNLCVDKCPLSPDYFGEDLNDGKRKCELGCTLSDVFADPITRTCVKQCNNEEGYFGYLTNRRCVLKCPVGYGNPITKLCTATCPQSPIQTYGDNLTATCVKRCPNNTYGDKTQELCVNATDCPSNTYGEDSTNLCVRKCSVLLSTYGDPVTKKCVKSCQYGYFSDNTTRLCTQTCNTSAQLYKDWSTRRCVLDCPLNPDLYNDPANKECVANCTSASYPYKYRYMNVRRCVSMCPSSPAYFADEQTKNCVLRCANGTFRFVNNTYRGCLSYCPLQIFNATINTTLYEDNTTWTCVAVCPPGYYAFKHPSNLMVRKCVKMCQIVSGVYYFADDVSRSCVTQCPTKVYNTWGDRLIFRCVKNCTRKQYRDITKKQCTYNCPQTPVEYFADNSTWNCSKTCPNGTFAEPVNNTCVKQCPTNTFGYAQKCMDVCPPGTTVYQDNTTWSCVNKCTMLPDYYSDAGNQKCVKNCTGNTFADWGTRSCVAAIKCTGTTVADPLTFRCVAQCSKVPMYFVTPSTNLCGAFCTGGLFAFNDTNKCAEECPAPYFGVNSSLHYYCTEYCPTGEYKFINKTSLFRICISGCPIGYFAFGPSMQCVQLCPDGYWGNSSNNQCVQNCTPLYADDSTNMCVGICPNGTTADNNTYTCKGKCKYGEFMENKVCVTACSPTFFADNLTRACLKQCPIDPFTFADPFLKKCVFQCSSGYFGYFDNRTCQLGACPTGLFKQTTLRICINPCLEGQFGDPQSLQCVTTCVGSTYIYADPTSQQCVMKCPSSPDLYGLSNICIDQCPFNKFAENQTRTCVSICPNKTINTAGDSYADDLTRRCVSRCSALSYAYQNITHNVCINNCTNGLFASQIEQACVKVCPNTTFARNNTHECVSRCPSGSWGDVLTKTCMDGCYNSQFADNSTNMCVNKCPSDPDLYGERATNSCVFKCQSGFYSHPIDRICVSNCDAPYYADPSSLLCVLDCPMHQFIYAYDYNRTCISKCDNNSGIIYYADPTTKKCKTQCPQLPKLLYGLNATNTCEQTCPSGTFGDNDTRLCLKECIFQSPKFTWMDRVDKMCVKECPLGYFSDNVTKSCQQVCSVGMYADNSTRKCVYGCPVNPSSFATTDSLGNPVCTYTCRTGLYADEVSRSCVPKCPLSPFYYFHMNLTNSCEKECIFPYFGEKESQFCVPQCKDGFYGNLTTKKCEACRTQCVTCSAYLECLTCQIGFYLYEFQCVTACPTYPILYFSLQSSTKCFRKCPAPYYGLQSTKKCQLGCPVSYYPNDLTRICTLCPAGCLTCDSKGCLSCLKGYTYLNTTRSCNQYCNLTHIYYFKDECYNVCPEGSFLSKDLVHCDPCATECAACSLSAANCTKCANKFYYQGLCVDACPSQFFVNEELVCIACSVNPERCKLDPLTYNITPFTENFKQKAYVTFSRPVSMTLDEFAQAVQINFNDKPLKAGEFSAVVFNSTTYVVTILVSSNEEALKIQYKPRSMQQTSSEPESHLDSLIGTKQNPSSFEQVSLNQNSLTIGFKPGTITDTSGNILTVNSLQQKFEASTDVINEQTALLTQKISSSALAITWIFMAVVFLLLIKTGYPVLILLEVGQIIYMHIFLYASPMPFLELKFLDELKSFHFTFFPQLIKAGISEKAYQNVSIDLSFLANASPFIFVWGIVGFVYLLFAILSSKKIKNNKTIRKFAKRARKYRLRFGVVNDAFWITYIYAMFFAMYQFKNATFGNGLMVGNFFFACVVFVLYVIFTVYMVKLASQHKGKKQEEIPKKFRFITPEPSSFPMEMPMRYIRKLCLCFALVMPSFQAQIVIMLMTNIVFMTYCMCFTPSKSKLTNYVNFIIEIGYVVIEGLFYAYFKLQQKTSEEQMGFAFTLIAVQALMLLIVFLWAIYRLIGDFKKSDTWKYIYMKLTENTDPEYLKQEQKKRDLQFDFGSLENQSHIEDHEASSKNLQLKKRTFNEHKVFFDAQVGAKKQKKVVQDNLKQKKTTKRTSTQLSDKISINEKSLQEKYLMKNSSSKDQVSQQGELNDKELQSTIKVLQPKMTRIKTPFAGKRSQLLKVDSRSEQEMQEVVIYNNGAEEEKKQEKKCIWDDLEFDENQI